MLASAPQPLRTEPDGFGAVVTTLLCAYSVVRSRVCALYLNNNTAAVEFSVDLLDQMREFCRPRLVVVVVGA